ncbi:MAG: peptidoglycan-binding domain-containing protein [Christensenellales bacterium]
MRRQLGGGLLGQSGETVRRVQQKLKQWGYYTGAVDGVFGRSTYDAVIQFQKERPDGGWRRGYGNVSGDGHFKRRRPRR